jgi:hypothetical protein
VDNSPVDNSEPVGPVTHTLWNSYTEGATMVGMAEPATTERKIGWPAHVDGEWTVEMLETLPDDGLRYELIDGTLIVSPHRFPVTSARSFGWCYC